MRTLARSIWSKFTRSASIDAEPRSEARTLAGLAGTPNAIVRTKQMHTRRGTFLVLVVGTLALLSVIAIVYVTIGTQDTRVQAAAVRKEKIEDVPQRVGDYLANIIGQDRLATFYDDSTILGGDGLPVMMRQISDYPATDPQVRSDISNSGIDFRHASWRFDPAGRIDTTYWFGPASNARAAVPPSDPWLSSSEPTWIGVDPANPDRLANPTDVTRLYRDMRDWAHISNFAPNGRFINLFNLRGNINAQPGTNPGQMSFGLTLYTSTGEATNQTLFGVVADPNVPYAWDTNQRGAARPAAVVPYGPAANLSTENPGSPNFKLYQWADADGDGILDVRWMELVDDRNGILNYLGDTGRYRYFVAARAVDLSARVNVNVAADFLSAVRIDAPAGITPADIDLRRLLALTDSFDFNAPTSNPDRLGGGYDNFRNPSDPLLAGNYGPIGAGGNQIQYPPANLNPGYARNRALQVAEFGYAALRLSMAAGIPLGPTTLDGSTKLHGPDLLTTVPGDLSLTPDLWNSADVDDGARRRRAMYQRTISGGTGVRPEPAGWRSSVHFAMPDLAELLTRNSINDPDTFSSLELVLGGRDSTTETPGSGSARYSPLRDNRDLKLELAAVPDPAYDIPNIFDSNGDTSNPIGAGLEAFQTRYLAHAQTDIRQRLTTLSGSVPLRPVRGVHPWTMTVNELPTDIGAILDPQYDPIETITEISQGTEPDIIRPSVQIDNAEAKSIFRAYADQLLPFSGVTVGGTNAWTAGSRAPGPLQTMSYGYRGPEVALYAAAHMTANFIDMADRERMTKNNNASALPARFDDDYELNIPSVYTLILRPYLATASATARVASIPSIEQDLYVADRFTRANPLDIRDFNLNELTGTSRLPVNQTAQTVTPPNQVGVNIFGIEAQPFLTRVSVFTTYISSDVDETSPVRFNVAMNQANSDFGYRVVAWQLTNPFNVPVVLWDNTPEGPNANQAEKPRSRFYIEMDGRTYLIRPLTDDASVIPESVSSNPVFPESDRNIIIYPQRTIVLYTLSQAPDQISSRLPNNPGGPAVREAIERAMGEVSDNDPGDPGFPVANPQNYSPDLNKIQAMYYIGAVDPASTIPRSLTTPAPAAFSTLLTSDSPESRLWRRVRSNGSLDLSGGGGLPTIIEFDQLLDRLRVPDGDPNATVDPDTYPVLNRRLGNPASDTGSSFISFDAGDAGFEEDEFNRPVITLWASVRRPANPGEPPMGALPAYCLEPKGSSRWNVFNNDRFNLGATSWDPINSQMPRTGLTLRADMFESGDWPANSTRQNAGYTKFGDWWNSIRDQGFTYVPSTQSTANEDNSPVMLNIVPNFWGTTTFNPQLRTLVGNSDRTDGNSASNADRYNVNLQQTRYYNQWYPQVILNNSYFAAPFASVPGAYARSVRVADMLLPLAVGPMMNPAFPSDDSADSGETQELSGREWTNMELRWTTLGEAMAVAMGYQPTLNANNADSLSTNDIASLSNPYSFNNTPARANYINRPLFDRGQLRLDEFVLFRDRSTAPARLGIFDYASDGTADSRLFTEAPAALGIFDAFTVSPVGIVRTVSAASLTDLASERDAAELTRPVPGLININTASPTVLRTMPGLAPWEDSAQRNQIVRLTLGSVGTPAQGDFALQVGASAASGRIDATLASAGALQAYIESIPGVGSGNVKVTKVENNPPTFDVEFLGARSAVGAGAVVVTDQTTNGSVVVTAIQAPALPLIGPIWANGALLGREVDLVAVITATRDKSRQFLRPQSSVAESSVSNAGLDPDAVRQTFDPGASANFSIEQLSFLDREPGGTGFIAARDIIWPQNFAPALIQTWLGEREGRRAVTEVRGISEREGFLTVGSIQAAASVRDGNDQTNRLTGRDTNGVLVDFGALPISIDFMGYKTQAVLNSPDNQRLYGANNGQPRAHQNTSQAGLSSGLFQTLWVTNGDRANRDRFTSDAVPGDYAEKLTPMAAISNIATTRSDFFAVWFVIHGYTAEDVVGLAPTDPLSPSVARRFLMVVDRSNVTSQSDRPKVVLFREVPYTP